MKKWLKITLWVLVLLLVCTVFFFAFNAENKKKLRTPAIAIHVEGESAFLTEKELIDRLKIRNLFRKEMQVGSLKIHTIERHIKAMPEVKKVEVYKHIGDKWEIQLELRKPIARIFNSIGQSYYLDQDGFMMYRSALHTARVLVFSGAIHDVYNPRLHCDFINNGTLKSSQKINQIYHISNYVCNDPLMHKLIGQIHLQKNGDFVLIPLLGDQKIIFGAAPNSELVQDKFERLKHFYKEALPHEGWNKYKEISVKYEGQIVCRKR